MGFNQRTGVDILFDIIVSSDEGSPEAERIYIALEAKYQPILRLKINSNAVLLNISPYKTV
jgi:hypothetical protein